MLRVLVADEHHAAADSTARVLRQFGHEATAVHTGQGAVEMAAFLRPDVFISNVIMPGITGIEAGILVRLMLPPCRVILLTEESLTAGLFERAKSRGHVFETIAKPIEPKALLSLLNRPFTANPLHRAERLRICHFGEIPRL